VPPVRTPYQAAARQQLRETLLEAARDLLRERRWTDITMAQIATASGVSRQTLYNEFGSRSGFVQTYLLYDANRILTIVEDAIWAIVMSVQRRSRRRSRAASSSVSRSCCRAAA
jgi:AcrR family transcriptional regulator